jgi:hypothetical protein
VAKLWTKEGILAPKSIQHLCHLSLGSWQAELNAHKTYFLRHAKSGLSKQFLSLNFDPIKISSSSSVSSIGTFLQEEIKLGFILKAQKCLHQFGGVQVHSTIALTLEMQVDSLPKSVHRAVRQVTVAVASIR